MEIGAFEGRPGFRGLGELTEDELEALWPERRPVMGERIELAVAAWDAFCAPEPTAVQAFLGRDSSSSPFLRAALFRLLEELPDLETGLARSERQLLEELAAGARTAPQLFGAGQEREEAPFEGDAWSYRRLAELGSGASPLVALAHGGAIPDPPPLGDARSFVAAPLALTDAGRAALAGEADRVELLGIDRWLGGVHLRPEQHWRWDRRARGVVARS